jgi:hypothetical protein
MDGLKMLFKIAQKLVNFREGQFFNKPLCSLLISKGYFEVAVKTLP